VSAVITSNVAGSGRIAVGVGEAVGIGEAVGVGEAVAVGVGVGVMVGVATGDWVTNAVGVGGIGVSVERVTSTITASPVGREGVQPMNRNRRVNKRTKR
jgi:hypothetical protein